MIPLAKGITESNYPNDAPIYSLKDIREEEMLFEVNDSLHGLISLLETKDNLTTEQENED